MVKGYKVFDYDWQCMGKQCDTIQVENASNDNPNKVEVAVPDDWYGETNIVY